MRRLVWSDADPFHDPPISLALYLGAQLVRASEDLTWVPAGALHRRFLGWLR